MALISDRYVSRFNKCLPLKCKWDWPKHTHNYLLIHGSEQVGFQNHPKTSCRHTLMFFSANRCPIQLSASRTAVRTHWISVRLCISMMRLYISICVKDYVTGHLNFPSEAEGKVIQHVLHWRKIWLKAILLSFPFISLCREVLLIVHLVFGIR